LLIQQKQKLVKADGKGFANNSFYVHLLFLGSDEGIRQIGLLAYLIILSFDCRVIEKVMENIHLLLTWMEFTNIVLAIRLEFS